MFRLKCKLLMPVFLFIEVLTFAILLLPLANGCVLANVILLNYIVFLCHFILFFVNYSHKSVATGDFDSLCALHSLGRDD